MQADFMNVMGKALIEQHPEDFIVDPVKLSERTAEIVRSAQAIRKENLERKPAPTNCEEYNRLRTQHFRLKEDAKYAEIRVNNSAGDIRNAEAKISVLLKQKKETDNPLHERNLERRIVVLEGELQAFKNQYADACKENKRAVEVLKAYDTTRLNELAEELGQKKV